MFGAGKAARGLICRLETARDLPVTVGGIVS
jgi:hypothetical protein